MLIATVTVCTWQLVCTWQRVTHLFTVRCERLSDTTPCTVGQRPKQLLLSGVGPGGGLPLQDSRVASEGPRPCWGRGRGRAHTVGPKNITGKAGAGAGRWGGPCDLGEAVQAKPGAEGTRGPSEGGSQGTVSVN